MNLPAQNLPIDDILPSLTDALRQHSALVLRAPTGAGKTTRVPPALLDAGLAGTRQIVMLEPRRLAARAAARRMASERGSRLGSEIGYHVRFDRKAGAETRILVVTEGILVRMLQRDPFLEDVGIVIFDEFHERNLQSDLALAMTRRVRTEAREDLAVVVMSATLDPEPIANYLGDCSTLESEGRLHPVTTRFLDRPDSRNIEEITAAGIRRALGETDGDILTFLPGVGEIRRTGEKLQSLARQQGLVLLELFGDLPPDQQDAVLLPGNRRRVVLATNVAETSVTLEGISAVVDSGWARELRFDPATGLDRLELVRISRASADQRAGRAGRLGPGLCLRMWTEHDHRSLAERTQPEIRRVDLSAPILQLLAWGERDVNAFEWFEAPEPAVVERTLTLLTDLGVRDASGLTEIGQSMARLPVHPRLARLIVEGHRHDQLERAAFAAALLSEREIVLRTPGPPPTANVVGDSDVVDQLAALESFFTTGYGETAKGPVHRGRARGVEKAGRQLARQASKVLGRSPSTAAGDPDETLHQALLAAYPDRVTRRRNVGSDRGVMVGGRGVRLSPSSCVRDSELFLSLDVSAGTRESVVRLASGIEESWLPSRQVEIRTVAGFDESEERVVCIKRKTYRDLVLAEKPGDPRELPDGAATVEQTLIDAAKTRLDRALDLETASIASFLARLRSLAEWRPDLELPTFDDEQLFALLPHLAAGKRSFAEIRRAPLLPYLQGALDYDQLRAVEQLAPERFEAPSGSHIRLDYVPGKPPVLAVRIQEMFGLKSTPAVAAGQVPVLLHLLAPNMRPQQVTRDLPSFWSNTYPEVRKELKGRYPKHSWPEDPLTAQPERRPRRRR